MTVVLFHFMNPESIPMQLTNLCPCLQHTAYIACWGLIEVANEQAESHKNICTMQLERLMIVNAMPAAMNRSSKLPSMRSLFVYALAYRSISKMVHLRRTKHTCATVLLGFRKFHKKGARAKAR